MRLLRVVHHQFDVLRAVYTHGNEQPREHPLLAAAAEQRSKQKKIKLTN